MNTALEANRRSTPLNRFAVSVRSFETMLRFSYRRALEVAELFCKRADVGLNVASPTGDPDDTGVIHFDTGVMRRTFETAARLAGAAVKIIQRAGMSFQSRLRSQLSANQPQ